MPTKKHPNKAKAAAPKKAAAPTPAPEKNEAQTDERAKAIAELVRGGMSYSEAKAAIDNDTPAPAKVELGPDPGADEEIDPDSIPDPDEDLEVVDIELR